MCEKIRISAKISAISTVLLVEIYVTKNLIGSVKNVTACTFVSNKNIKNIFHGTNDNLDVANFN